MYKNNIGSIISALILYGTEQEKRLAHLAQQHLTLEGRLTREQKSVLQNLFAEKTRWMRDAINSLKVRQNSKTRL